MFFRIIIWLINKFTILIKRWKLRNLIKIVELHGGKVRIKNNEFIGGTDVEIELPIDDEKTS
jgi:hypothetical protein